MIATFKEANLIFLFNFCCRQWSDSSPSDSAPSESSSIVSSESESSLSWVLASVNFRLAPSVETLGLLGLRIKMSTRTLRGSIDGN